MDDNNNEIGNKNIDISNLKSEINGQIWFKLFFTSFNS